MERSLGKGGDGLVWLHNAKIKIGSKIPEVVRNTFLSFT